MSSTMSSTMYLLYIPENFSIEEMFTFRERFNIFSSIDSYIMDNIKNSLRGKKFTQELVSQKFNDIFIEDGVCEHYENNPWYLFFLDYFLLLSEEGINFIIESYVSIGTQEDDIMININGRNFKNKIDIVKEQLKKKGLY